MKCIQCGKIIEEGYHWCHPKCKEQFYIDNYMGSPWTKIAEDYEKERKAGRNKTMKALKEYQNEHPGATYVDFLLSLGDFKEDKKVKNK